MYGNQDDVSVSRFRADFPRAYGRPDAAGCKPTLLSATATAIATWLGALSRSHGTWAHHKRGRGGLAEVQEKADAAGCKEKLCRMVVRSLVQSCPALRQSHEGLWERIRRVVKGGAGSDTRLCARPGMCECDLRGAPLGKRRSPVPRGAALCRCPRGKPSYIFGRLVGPCCT